MHFINVILTDKVQTEIYMKLKTFVNFVHTDRVFLFYFRIWYWLNLLALDK